MTNVNFVSIGAKINPSNSKIIPLEHRVKMRGDYPHLYVTKHARVGKNKHLLHSICVEQYSSHQPPYTAWTLNEIRETYEFPNRPAARWIACPVCGCPHGVGHFAWASLRCNECGFYSKKCDWIDFHGMTPREIAAVYRTFARLRDAEPLG